MYSFIMYAGAHFGDYYCMDINFWYSRVYHMEQRDHAVFFRNAYEMQIVCMINLLTIQHYLCMYQCMFPCNLSIFLCVHMIKGKLGLDVGQPGIQVVFLVVPHLSQLVFVHTSLLQTQIVQSVLVLRT